jgi:DNA-binding transcriptional regulator LsrR (DeoR family)
MTEPIPLDRLQLISEIAQRYYIDGLSQEEIAKKVDLSRPSISRLLVEARELGIVDIQINPPIPTVPDLENGLVEMFHLKEVRVVARKTAGDDDVWRMLGRLAANVLDRELQDGMVLGLAWGTMVHAVVQALHPRRLPNVKVVQLIGGIGAPHSDIDGPEQVRRTGGIFGAQHYYLNAPMRVDNGDVARALREDHTIKEVLELAQRADVAIVGIGSIDPKASTHFHVGYVSYEELRQLDKAGAVGAMIGFYFNLEGEHIPLPWLDPSVIGVSSTDLDRFGLVIGVAAGRIKVPAILGAIRTGLLDVLVTDDVAAEGVLALAQAAPDGAV